MSCSKCSRNLESLYEAEAVIEKEDRDVMGREAVGRFVKHVLMKNMKEDDLFGEIFSDVYHTGSYYEDLRVSEASEFDLNVVLKCPDTFDQAKFELKNVEPGFAKVYYETAPYPDLMDDSDEGGGSDRYYLDVEWTRKWFWRLVKRAVGQLKSARSNRHGQKKRPKKEEEKEKKESTDENEKEDEEDNESYKHLGKGANRKKRAHVVKKSVRMRRSGPAVTLSMTVMYKGQGCKVDVDLVPVFQYPVSAIRDLPRLPVELKKGNFFLVPKPPRILSHNYCSRSWRMSFPEQEKSLLHGKDFEKTVVKMMKLYRERNDELRDIFSYALKTTVLQITRKSLFLDNGDLGQGFVQGLIALRRYLSKGSLPYIFDKRVNVLSSVDKKSIALACAWLTGQIDAILKHDEDECEALWEEQFNC